MADINAETWSYDEPSQTMSIESIEGQNDRKLKLTVICSSDVSCSPLAPPWLGPERFPLDHACYHHAA